MVDTATPLISNEIIDLRRDAELEYSKDIGLYRAYAEGKHQLTLSVDQQKLLRYKIDHHTADNVCNLILSTAASRLKLERWNAADDEGDAETTTAAESRPATVLRGFLNRLWVVNRLRRLQYETHFAFLRDGNAAISLSWKADKPGSALGDVRLTRESWWDGDDGVFIAYDALGDAQWAVKEFDDASPDDPKKTIHRRTVYYPDKIVKYVQQGNGWAEFGPQPIQPWVKGDGSPLGIPIVHFPNGSQVGDAWYGQSDLAGLIGLQDDLNTMQHDMSAASMFTGFQQYTATGVDNPQRLKVAPGGLISSSKPDARFGTLPPGDMSQLTSAHTYKRQTMAVDSSTPIHVISGVWPSGDAIMRADQPLIDKVERLASIAGPQWATVAHFATEIANVFGRAGIDENIPITAVFAPAERIDEATELELQDRKVRTWEVLSRLPKTAMLKTGMLNEKEADEIIKQRQAEFGVIADMATGEVA